MMSKIIPAMLCAVLLIYGPIAEAASGATPVLGQVTVKGNAKVNGIATPSGAAVFSGDRVGTETNTIAELLLNGGSRVMLPDSTIVVLRNDADQVIVDLKQGALAALSKSASPAFIDANGVRIKPAEVAAVVEVAVQGNSLKVAVRRGSAIVESADKTIEVKEGKELDATLAPPPPQGPTGGGPHPSMRSSLATWELITAAAAGLTGLVLGAVAISRANPADCKVASPSGTIVCP